MEWIQATEDNMPEKNTSVLVTTEGGEWVGLAWRTANGFNGLWEDAFAIGLDHITHWMPLPPPPDKG